VRPQGFAGHSVHAEGQHAGMSRSLVRRPRLHRTRKVT
jgi:hypothetical protein